MTPGDDLEQLDSILREADSLRKSKASASTRQPAPGRLPGTLPDPRQASDEVPVFDPAGDELDAIIAEAKSLSGKNSAAPPSILLSEGDAGSGVKVLPKVRITDAQAPVIAPVKTAPAKKPSYRNTFLGIVAPGVADEVDKFYGESGNPAKEFTKREQLELKRMEALKKEKARVIEEINKAQMQGAAKDSDYVKKKQQRLYYIDQALTSGKEETPSILATSGKSASKLPKVRITDAGPESQDDRRIRLTNEYNQIGPKLNKLGQQLSSIQQRVAAGQYQLSELKAKIDAGDQSLVPEYNRIVRGLQQLATQGTDKMEAYNSLVSRAKPVAKAIDEYRTKDAKSAPVQENVSAAERFIRGLGAFLFQGEYAGDIKGKPVRSDGSRNMQALASAAGAFTELPKEAIRGASNQIAIAAGLGEIDPTIYKTDRATQISNTIGEAAPYLLPGVGQVLMGAQSIAISANMVQDPVRTTQAVLDSINPFASGLKPEERGVRATSLLLLAASGKVKVSEAVLKKNLMNRYGLTESGANTILDWGRSNIKAQAGSGVKGDLVYYLETLKGTKLGKVANQTAEQIYEAYQKYKAQGAQFAKDAKRAGAVDAEGKFVQEGTPLTGNVRPQTNAPELPGPSGVPSSATRPVNLIRPDGSPTGYQIRATGDRVQLINTDGGIVEFPFAQADSASYQSALSQARAYADANPAAKLPDPIPDAPVEQPRNLPWTDDAVQQYLGGLKEQNPTQKLLLGGSMAGKTIDQVGLGEGTALLNAWNEALRTTQNGTLKAQLLHDIEILTPHVERLQAEADQIKLEHERIANEEKIKLAEQDQGKQVATETRPTADPTSAWNNVQKYELSKTQESELTGNRGYKEIGNTGWFVGDASGGVGMFRLGEGRSYYFPFNDDEEGARKAAREWAKANPYKFSTPERIKATEDTIYGYLSKDKSIIDLIRKGDFTDDEFRNTAKDAFGKFVYDLVGEKDYDAKNGKKEDFDGWYRQFDDGDLFKEIKKRLVAEFGGSPPKGESEPERKPEGIKNVFKDSVEQEIASFQDAIDKLPPVPKNLDAKKFSKENEDRVGNKAIHELLLRRALEKAIKDKDAYNGRQFAQEVNYLAGTKGQKGLPPASVDALIDYLGLPEGFDPTSLLAQNEKPLKEQRPSGGIKVNAPKGMSPTLAKDLEGVSKEVSNNPKLIQILENKENWSKISVVADVQSGVWEDALINAIDKAEASGRNEDSRSLSELITNKQAYIDLLNAMLAKIQDQQNKQPKEETAPAPKESDTPKEPGPISGAKTIHDILREFDDSKSADLVELSSDLKRMIDKTISLWDKNWAEKESLRGALISKIGDMIFNNAPDESPLIDKSSEVAQKIAEGYIQKDVQYTKNSVAEEITSGLYNNDAVRNAWASGDLANYDTELSWQYGQFIGNRLRELAISGNSRGLYAYSDFGPYGSDDYKVVRQKLDWMLAKSGINRGPISNTGAGPKTQINGESKSSSKETLGTQFDVRGNASLLELAFQLVEPSKELIESDLSTRKSLLGKAEQEIEKLVLSGQIVAVDVRHLPQSFEPDEVPSPKEAFAVMAGTVPLRWGASRILVVTAKQAKLLENKEQLSKNWTLWQYEFNPKEDAYIVSDSSNDVIDFLKSAKNAVKEVLQGIDSKNQSKDEKPATIEPKETPNATDQRERDQLGGDQETQGGAETETPRPELGSPGGSEPADGRVGLPDSPTIREDDGRGEEPTEVSDRDGRGQTKRRGKNLVITDEMALGKTTKGQKQQDLIAALETINELRKSKKAPTPEQQQIIARYPGTGWTGNDFNEQNSRNPKFRDAVKELVDADTWATMLKSTVNSHYTAIPLVDFHWDVAKRLGFKSGKVLETSAGIGYFAGRAPKGADMTLVEFSNEAAEILGYLYPQSEVIHSGFEKIEPQENFDLVISNFPFAIAINDPAYKKKLGFGITERSHNYFFARALDHLRPGGLIVATTSAGTLNARDATAQKTREYLAKHADFVGAIRLPNNAFAENAGTEVTTDIIVFRKKVPGETFQGHDFQNIVPVTTAEGTTAWINEYFAGNPQMVLGIHSMSGTMRGDRLEYTLLPDGELGPKLEAALKKLPAGILAEPSKLEPKGKKQKDSETPVPPIEVKPNRFFVHEDGVFLKKTTFKSEATPAEHKAQLEAYVKLRDAWRKTLSANQESQSEAELKTAQQFLKSAYDAYVKKFGKIAATKNKSLLGLDEDFPYVKALENEDGSLAAVFTQRIISYSPPITKAETPQDALVASLRNLGEVSLPYMAKLLGKKEAEVAAALKGVIFDDPETGKWVTREDYGSGNVKKRLRYIQSLVAKKGGEKYKPHEEFLISRQPKDVTVEQAFVGFGAKYVPAKYYKQFLVDMYGAPEYGDVFLSEDDSGRRTWNVQMHFPYATRVVLTEPVIDKETNKPVLNADGQPRTIESGSIELIKIIQSAINNKQLRIMSPDPNDPEGKKMIFDEKLTALGNSKAQEIRTAWGMYWKEDPEGSKEIVDLYNEIVNVYNYRTYDGSHLELPGSSTDIKLRSVQKNMVWRGMVQDFCYAAHGVGVGKTFEMIALSKELKRIGKRNKVVILCLPANYMSVAADYKALYPGANVLVAGSSSLDKKNRAEFLGRVAAGDYDAIIMQHQQFKKIPVSPERQEAEIQKEIEKRQELMDRAAQRNGKNDKTVKAQEAAIAKLEEKLSQIQFRMREWQDSGGIYYEDLGIDHILVDEFHFYKNIPIVSEDQTYNKPGSDIARDMKMKIEYIRENNGGATFFSGTPIVNSIDEAYMIFAYTAPEVLEATQTTFFDDWIATYGSPIQKVERTVTGEFKPKTSIFSFNNLPELKIQTRNFMDIMMLRDVEKLIEDGKPLLKLPKLRDWDGSIRVDPIAIVTTPSKYQNDYFVYGKERAAKITYPVKKGDDNVLSVSTDMRKASIEIRLIDSSLPDDPNGKINKIVDTVMQVFDLPEAKENKATQLILLNYGVPKKTSPPPKDLFFEGIDNVDLEAAIKAINEAEYDYDVIENDNGTFDVIPNVDQEFNLYQDIKDKLIAKGVPAEEIAFIHDYQNPAKRKKLFADMNEGKMRVLIASTKKGGTGVNIQKRLLAIHTADAPWTPADMEQGDGRGRRQGNIFDKIFIFRHVMENTYDGFMFNKIEKKSKLNDEFFSDDLTKRSVEDNEPTDGEIYERLSAIASGRTDILDFENAKKKYNELAMQRRSWESGVKRSLKSLEETRKRLVQQKQKVSDMENLVELEKKVWGDEFRAQIGNDIYEKKFKEPGNIVLATAKSVIESIDPDRIYGGLSKNVMFMRVGDVSVEVLARWESNQSVSGGKPVLRLVFRYKDQSYRISGEYSYSGSDIVWDDKDFGGRGTNIMLGLWGQRSNKADEIKKEKQTLLGIESTIPALEKQSEKPFAMQKEFEAANAEYDRLYALVGVEAEQGGFGQFGSGEKFLPDGYWEGLRQAKNARNNAREAAKEKSKNASASIGKMEESDTPPKAKPGGVISGGTNIDDYMPEDSKYAKLGPIDAMIRLLNPASRGADARRTAILLRKLNGREARAEAAIAHIMSDIRKYFDSQPVEKAHEFIDAIENGREVPDADLKVETWLKSITPKQLKELFDGDDQIETLGDAAKLIRTLFDSMRERINTLDPSKLNEYYEYYFPHIWQIDKTNPTKVQQWIRDALEIRMRVPGAGKRPIEGGKSFLKKRTIPTIKEGLEKGLKLVSDNPVDIILLKLREMNKFIIATEIKNRQIADGTAVFVPIGKSAPYGFTKVNSTFYDVYSPGEITVKFAYDQKMMDTLMAIADKLGINVTWKNSVGRGKGGGTKYGEAGGKTVNMRYGANLDVLVHEIGHILDERTSLAEKMVAGPRANRRKGEMPTLADLIHSQMVEVAKLRYESVGEEGISDSYARYTERTPELIANFIHVYVLDKKILRKFAPDALERFEEIKKGSKELKLIDTIERGPELGEMEATYKVFGRTQTGSYYLPDQAAQVINNYLSPGLSGSDKLIVRDTYQWVRTANNALNSIQLGFDGFHGLVTALNAAMTDLESSAAFMEAGDFRRAFKQAAIGTSLVLPLGMGFARGLKIKNAYLSRYTEDENLAQAVDWLTRAGGRATPDPVYMNDFRRKLRMAYRDRKNMQGFADYAKLPLTAIRDGWYLINALNETTSHWLMESLVPALKLYAFETMASAEVAKLMKQKPDYTDADLDATLQRAWDSVDNRFGQMVYDNLFFDKLVKDTATITFRAFGWSYGTIREVGGAALDTAGQIGGAAKSLVGGGGGGSKPPSGGGIVPGGGIDDGGEPFVPRGSTPRQRFSLIGLPAITVLVSSIIHYLMTGKRPEELRDVMFPKSGGKNPDGSDERLVVPTYTKDVEAWVTRPGQTLSGKIAPWWTAVTSVTSNQDFYGVQIANPRGSLLSQGADKLRFIANEFKPIAFRQKNEFDSDGISLAGMSFSGRRWIGIMPAPMWTTRSEAIQKAYQFRANRVAGIEKTREEQTSRDAVRFIQELMYNQFEAASKGDEAKQKKIIARFNEIAAKYPKEVEKARKNVMDSEIGRPRTPIEIAINNLSLEELVEVRKVASAAEVPFINYHLKTLLGKKIEKKQVKPSDPVVQKAVLAMEGKL